MSTRCLRPLLVANYDYVLGGGEIVLLMLAEGLQRRGHRPLIGVPGSGRFAEGFERRRIGARRPQAARDLQRLARSCDLLHTYSTGGLVAALEAATGKPVVWHALLPNPTPLDGRLAKAADLVICNSQATASRFEARENVTVVYEGVRPPRPVARPLPLRRGQRTVAIVGGTEPRKGQVDALPALEAVLGAREDVDVVFIGRIHGSNGRRLRAAAAAWGERMRLLGFIPDVADRMGELALVLVPSRSEGFGRVAVEALRAATPVLATRVEGLQEALAALPDPWLPADRDAWAQRIVQELDQPPERAQLLAAARRFDPDRFTERIVALYEGLLAGT